jgi:hypothetical protein
MPRPPAIRCKREPGSHRDHLAGKWQAAPIANDGPVAMKWHDRIAQGRKLPALGLGTKDRALKGLPTPQARGCNSDTVKIEPREN